MDSTIVNSIIGLSFRPLMLLTLGLGIAALVSGVLTTGTQKRWIPLTCGIAVLALVGFQLARPYSILYSTIGSYGLGKPEIVAQATLSFLSAAFITPFVMFIALFGMMFALFSNMPKRFILLIACWALFIGADAVMVKRFDADFSRSMADGRWERDDQLMAIQQQAYLDTLRDAGQPLTDEEKSNLELYLPLAVSDEIFRDDFFKIHKPESMLTALLLDRYDEALQKNDAMLDSVIIDAHRETCIEEGRRLALEQIKQQPSDKTNEKE